MAHLPITSPSDIEAEVEVLRACFVGEEPLKEVVSTLTGQHFAHPLNREVFLAVEEAVRDGGLTKVSPADVRDRLEAEGAARAHLRRLMQADAASGSGVTPSRLGRAMKRLDDARRGRELLAITEGVKTKALAMRSEEALDDLMDGVFALSRDRFAGGAMPIEAFADEFLEELGVRRKKRGIVGLRTNVKCFDVVFKGLQRQCMYVVGARPGQFKCHAEGTEVLTPRGPVPIQELTPGDFVYGYNGDGSVSETRVKDVVFTGVRGVVEIKHRGRVIAASTPEHRWLVGPREREVPTSEVLGFSEPRIRRVPVDDAPLGETAWDAREEELEVSEGRRYMARTWDIEVDNETHLYLLANEGLVTHNSSVANQAAMEVAKQGKRVLIQTPEMSGVQLFSRHACAIAGVDPDKFNGGTYSDDEERRLKDAAQLIRGRSIIIDPSGHQTTRDIRQNLVRWRPDLLVVDYLGLIDPPRKQFNEYRDVTEACRQINAMKKDFDIPILLLSQLSRRVEESWDKRPNMSHLRSTGQIEADADGIVLLWHPKAYAEEREPGQWVLWKDRERGTYEEIDPELLEFVVGKNRHGYLYNVKSYVKEGSMLVTQAPGDSW